MIGEDTKGETGYGISPYIPDNEYPILHVYPDKRTVKEKTEKGKVLNTWTFESFIESPEDAPESTSTGQ